MKEKVKTAKRQILPRKKEKGKCQKKRTLSKQGQDLSFCRFIDSTKYVKQLNK